MSETPKKFGPFEVLRHVSSGTLGDVYLCRRTAGQAKDAVPFIVKTFRPEFVEMRKEISILERPVHKCLIQYRQVGYDAEAERYFTVMDRLQVEPHSAQLMRRTKLNFKQKIKRFIEVGEALAALHEIKIPNQSPDADDRKRRPSIAAYHGALKPSNILVRYPDTEYHMLVSDFGFLYRYVPELYTESHSYFESWLFLPPEVILHAVPDYWPKQGLPPSPCPASDVYSWALILVYSLNGGRDGFYYVTGKTQQEDKFDERVREDLQILYQKKLDIQDRWTLVVGGKAELERDKFIEFIFKALSPDPRDRHENMREALQAFQKCLL